MNTIVTFDFIRIVRISHWPHSSSAFWPQCSPCPQTDSTLVPSCPPHLLPLVPNVFLFQAQKQFIPAYFKLSYFSHVIFFFPLLLRTYKKLSSSGRGFMGHTFGPPLPVVSRGQGAFLRKTQDRMLTKDNEKYPVHIGRGIILH